MGPHLLNLPDCRPALRGPHGVDDPPTLSHLHFLLFQPGFLCLGLPGATWPGSIRRAGPQPPESISAPVWERDTSAAFPSHPCLCLLPSAHFCSQPFASGPWSQLSLHVSASNSEHPQGKPLSSKDLLHDRKRTL